MVPDGCRYHIDLVVGQDGHLAEGAGIVREAEDCLVVSRRAVGIGLDEVHVNDLIECLVWSGNVSSILYLSLLQAVRQVCFLPVLDLKIVLNHGVSQSIQSFQLGGTQRGFGDKIPVERESCSLKVLVEVVHPPGSGGCLQEEPGVVFLVLPQLSRGMRDDLDLAQVVSLCQIGTEAPG